MKSTLSLTNTVNPNLFLESLRHTLHCAKYSQRFIPEQYRDSKDRCFEMEMYFRFLIIGAISSLMNEM